MPRSKAQPVPEYEESQRAQPPLMSYDVRIHALQVEGNRKAAASVNLNGQFAVRGVSVMEGSKGLFVSMPSRKTSNGYQE